VARGGTAVDRQPPPRRARARPIPAVRPSPSGVPPRRRPRRHAGARPASWRARGSEGDRDRDRTRDRGGMAPRGRRRSAGQV